MQAAKELKIDVPQDLSVIGFDDTVLSTTHHAHVDNSSTADKKKWL